jgi:integrase
VLLIIVATLARSDEICGLAVDDVFLDCETPYIHIRRNALRRLKNASSERRVPIASKILELGFADYVAAMRKAGHKALFPEYLHPTMDFEKVFRKDLFDPLRKHVFPNGTSRKRGRKDVDVHSIRTFGLASTAKHFEETRNPAFDKDHRKALSGHEPGDTTSGVYEEDLEPRDLVPMVEYLASFIPPIPKRPLNLRPPEFQKFGKPKGRRRKMS